jgi:heat shock protein HslJ
MRSKNSVVSMTGCRRREGTKMRVPVRLVQGAAVAAALLAGACTNPPGKPPTTTPPAPIALEDVNWVLDTRSLGTPPPGGGGGSSPPGSVVTVPPEPTATTTGPPATHPDPPEPGRPPGRAITAMFTNQSLAPSAGMGAGLVTGSAGCNSYSGTYVRNQEKLTVGTITQTLVLCDPNTMRLEQAYLARLQLTRSHVIETLVGRPRSEAVLRLQAADGSELRFTAAAPPPPTPPRAVEGSWEVTGYLSGSGFVQVPSSAPVSLELRGDGSLSGQACNIFGGTWSVEGRSIRLRAAWMTERACAPGPAADQDAHFVPALHAATRWQVMGTTLVLSDGNGTRVVTASRNLPKVPTTPGTPVPR